MVGKYGYKKRISAKRKLKKLKREELLRRDVPDLYFKMVGRGYEKEKAIEKVKNATTPLERLIQRYETNVKKPGVIAISLDGIKRTSKVDDWIEDMVEQGLLKDKGTSLVYPINPMLGRHMW